MSTGLYTHTTRATGTVLTASIYNADHVNHITNQNPSQTGAFSDNVAQMQSTATPGGVGSESLATSLAGELQRIRFQLNAIIGGAQWYSAPATTLQSLAGAGVSDNSITNAKLADMAQALIKARDAGGGTGDPQDLTLTQVLDFVGSAANGDMLFRTGGVWSRLAIGTASQFLQVSGGVPSWQTLTITAAKQADQQTFTGSGTWNKPGGFGAKAYALIQCWGGGGGGARNAGTTNTGGGGGGLYAERRMLLSSLGGTETVTIGAGGAGASSNGANGGAGGNTTFGTWLTGFGGGGGGANGNPGGGGIVGFAGVTSLTVNAASRVNTITANAADPGGCPPASAGFVSPTAPWIGGMGGDATNASNGMPALMGGAGGAQKTASNGTAGTSQGGGNGGGSGSNGAQPGGGGGGQNGGVNGGTGGAGQCTVTVFDGA